MRDDLPTGTVTFLFTDIEGSTRLLDELGAKGYADELTRHRAILRHAFARHHGVEVDTQGDAFFFAFADAEGAVDAAAEAQSALAEGSIHVRIGLHTGEPLMTSEGYVGREVNRAARIAAAGHGGQVLISRETRSALNGDVALLDLGEHRLKDFIEPMWIYQLGTERFPPLKTISNTNLPRPASSFVGREREVGAIGDLLRDGARLVTLTGPGGTGKTRLAIEAATELVPAFRNGVFWIDLASLRDSALVSETIGQTLGAKYGLAEHIGEREMLLLLDNLEQVVSAAPELASLAETCPNLRLLVTSRERLRVRGEVEYAVPPLANEEAVSLFCERAQLAPDDTIVELCRRLDDLPLAVELAAARVSVLSPAQILERLAKRLDLLKGGRDAGARQQTLRATIEWSYDLLNDDEKSLFARLAVFRGGCTLQAAEDTVAADLDAVQSLADKSLLRRRDDRYEMLETVREFAAERLAESEQGAGLRRRHADHYLALAEEAEPHLPAYDRPWISRLENDHDNLRAAFDYFGAAGDGRSMQRLVGALGRFWFMRGYVSEGRTRAAAALAADDRPTPARAVALLGATLVGAAADEERRLATEALALFRQLGDRRGAAIAELMIGDSIAGFPEWQTAIELVERSIATLTELGEGHHALIGRRGLAWMYLSVGRREEGITLHRENLQLARSLGNVRIEAITLGALASEMIAQGQLDEAKKLLKESHRLHVSLGDPFQSALDVFRFAYLLLASGHTESSARLAACAESLIAEMGLKLRDWDPIFIDEVDAGLRAALDPPAYSAASAQGSRMTAEAAVNLALAELALDQPRSASGT